MVGALYFHDGYLIGYPSAQEPHCLRTRESINSILGLHRIWITHCNPSRSFETDP